MAKKKVTVTIDRTNVLFLVTGLVIGWYLTKQKYAYYGEEEE